MIKKEILEILVLQVVTRVRNTKSTSSFIGAPNPLLNRRLKKQGKTRKNKKTCPKHAHSK